MHVCTHVDGCIDSQTDETGECTLRVLGGRDHGARVVIHYIIRQSQRKWHTLLALLSMLLCIAHDGCGCFAFCQGIIMRQLQVSKLVHHLPARVPIELQLVTALLAAIHGGQTCLYCCFTEHALLLCLQMLIRQQRWWLGSNKQEELAQTLDDK
jgi:hypothetical protein